VGCAKDRVVGKIPEIQNWNFILTKLSQKVKPKISIFYFIENFSEL